MTGMYKKIGRKYVQIAEYDPDLPFFPCDGIFLVQRTEGCLRQSQILKLGELKELYPYADMAVDDDLLCKEIARLYKEGGSRGISNFDLSHGILKFLAKLDLERREQRKKFEEAL